MLCRWAATLGTNSIGSYHLMTISSTVRNRPLLVLVSLMLASLAGLLLLPPILQDQSYHQFADQRNLLGIPNFWNVISNLPFIVVGVAGLWRFHRDPTTIVMFSGILFTGFGSSCYHMNPNDATLFWDRLPMTLCFAAILAAVVEERVDAGVGAILLWPLLVIGIFSLLLWRWTDDLRLYAWAGMISGEGRPPAGAAIRPGIRASFGSCIIRAMPAPSALVARTYASIPMAIKPSSNSRPRSGLR
jgi:hypothetical protein